MSKAIPREYRKPIPEKRFRKQVIGRIHVEKEREFYLQAFVAREDGMFVLRDDLTNEDHARLARVAKEIKQNRGLLHLGRLAIPLILVGGVVAFNLLFLNSLLQNAGERALERVFGARAEIARLEARLLDGTIELAGLTVADRDQPMRNLFELGRTALSIRVPELLTGRVVIREIAAEGLAFGTPRKVSGALQREAATTETDSALRQQIGTEVAARTTAGVAAALQTIGVGSLSFDPAAFDPAALVAQTVDQLRVLKVVPEAIERSQAGAAGIELQLVALRDATMALGAPIQQLTAFRPELVTNPQQLFEVVALAQGTTARATALRSDAERIRTAVEREVGALRAVEGEVRRAVAADRALLVGLIPPFELDPFALGQDAVRTFALGFLGEAWQTIQRIYGTAQRLRTAFPETGERAPGQRRGGVDVPFAATPYPRFLIESLSGQGTADGQAVTLLLRAISSDPNLTDTPTTIDFIHERGAGQKLQLTGAIDLRSAAETPLQTTIRAAGLHPTLPSGAGQLGFAALEGTTDLGGQARLEHDGRVRGDAQVQIAAPRLVAVAGAPPVSAFLAEIASAQAAIDAGMAFTLRAGAVEQFEARTSLTAALRDYATQLIAGLRAEAEQRIVAELERLVAAQVDRLMEHIGAIELLSGRSAEELLQIDTYRQIIAQKEAELTSRLTDLGAQLDAAAAQLRAAAEAAAAEARREAEAAAARLQAEAEAAAAQAQAEAAAAAAQAQAELAAAEEAARAAAAAEAARLQAEADAAAAEAQAAAQREAERRAQEAARSIRIPGIRN